MQFISAKKNIVVTLLMVFNIVGCLLFNASP